MIEAKSSNVFFNFTFPYWGFYGSEIFRNFSHSFILIHIHFKNFFHYFCFFLVYCQFISSAIKFFFVAIRRQLPVDKVSFESFAFLSFSRSFFNSFSLHFCDSSQQSENQFSTRRREVNALTLGDKNNSFFL